MRGSMKIYMACPITLAAYLQSLELGASIVPDVE